MQPNRDEAAPRNRKIERKRQQDRTRPGRPVAILNFNCPANEQVFARRALPQSSAQCGQTVQFAAALFAVRALVIESSTKTGKRDRQVVAVDGRFQYFSLLWGSRPWNSQIEC